MLLGRLAAHTSDLYRIIALSLTSLDLDWASWMPYTITSKQQLLTQFNENAKKAVFALKHTSDETFHQHWQITRGSTALFAG